MAGARFVYVVGIIVLAVLMLGVGLYGVSDFLQPMPSICAEVPILRLWRRPSATRGT